MRHARVDGGVRGRDRGGAAREGTVADLKGDDVLAAGLEFLGDGQDVERGFSGQARSE